MASTTRQVWVIIDQERDAALLAGLLGAMPDAVLVSDQSGIITQANGAAGALFSYDAAALIGHLPAVFPCAVLEKRLQTGDCASNDQRVNVMGALIGVHGFKVHHVAHDLEFFRNSVAAVHVA